MRRPCVEPADKLKTNSVALILHANYTHRRPPRVGEDSVNFGEYTSVAWSEQRVPTAVNLGFPNREPVARNETCLFRDIQ
jgi:hypothetical protein